MRIRNQIGIVSFALFCAFCSSTSEKTEPNTQNEPKTSGDSVGERTTGESCTPGCKNGNCTNGTGIFLYETCDEYNGWFVEGKRSGKGEFTYKNGDKFLGNYENDLRQGLGEYTFKNGDKMVIPFEQGEAKGDGTYIFKDGGILNATIEGNSGKGFMMTNGVRRLCEIRERVVFCEKLEQDSKTDPTNKENKPENPNNPQDKENKEMNDSPGENSGDQTFLDSTEDANEANKSEETKRIAEMTKDQPEKTIPAAKSDMLVLFAADDSVIIRNSVRLAGQSSMPLFPGDQLEVGRSTIEIQARGGIALRLKPFSVLYISPDLESNHTIILIKGSIIVQYTDENSKGKFPLKIISGNQKISVKGTTFIIEADEERRVVDIKVLEGKVEVTPNVPSLERFSKEEIQGNPALRDLVIISQGWGRVVSGGERLAVPDDNSLETGIAESLTLTPEERKKALKELAKEYTGKEPPDVESYEFSPQEKADAELLVTISEGEFETALKEEPNAEGLISKSTSDLIRQKFQNEAEKAIEILEKNLSSENDSTLEDLKTKYRIIEVVTFTDGSQKVGSVIAQVGNLVIMYTPDGIYRVETNDIISQDFYTNPSANR